SRAQPAPPTRNRSFGRCRRADHETSEPSGLSWRAPLLGQLGRGARLGAIVHCRFKGWVNIISIKGKSSADIGKNSTRERARFHGSFWGNYTALSEVMALASQGSIRHTIKTFTFDQINEYIDPVEDGELSAGL